jgi:probable rRNA maturation factor
VEVELNIRPGISLDGKTLRKACLKVMKAEGAPKDSILSLSAVHEDEIRELNWKYLEEDSPTDVLAFFMGEDEFEGHLLGDVIICPEFIEKEKGQYHVDAGRELEFVAAHGVLHLFGYEDRDEKAWRRMDSRQREILGLRGKG